MNKKLGSLIIAILLLGMLPLTLGKEKEPTEWEGNLPSHTDYEREKGESKLPLQINIEEIILSDEEGKIRVLRGIKNTIK